MNDVAQKARFFRHTECEYFPCHRIDDPQEFNCLFCYCPLYCLGERCGGAYSYSANGIKDCSRCLFPHECGNFFAIISRFEEIAKIAGRHEPHDEP